MSDSPFFTVAIPTYNRAGFLRQSLGAVLRQSFDDFELLVADNHSTDDTPQVVQAVRDPRVRYARHASNLGALENFFYVSRHAQGRFLVINQDDDLLHHDFLARAHAALQGHRGLTAYASAMWRGHPSRGFEAQLMGSPVGEDMDFILEDRAAVLDGKRAAVSFLYADYILHPAVALCVKTLQAVGGYTHDSEQVNDTITQARVFCEGQLAYDPRPGAVFRLHDQNAYRAQYSQKLRHRTGRNKFYQLIADFEERGIDWRSLLLSDLARFSRKEVVRCLGQWIRYHAPPVLQRVGLEALRRQTGKSGPRLVHCVVRQLGLSKSLRYAKAQMGAKNHASSTRSR